jgi:hypothetical protein
VELQHSDLRPRHARWWGRTVHWCVLGQPRCWALRVRRGYRRFWRGSPASMFHDGHRSRFARLRLCERYLGCCWPDPCGLALSPVFPTLMARAPERLGRSVALHAIGFKVSAAMVGGAVVPAIGGLLADAAGLNTISWCAVGGSCALLMLREALLGAPTSGNRDDAGTT